MTANILSKTIELRIVYRSGWYFYNRIRGGIEEVKADSITAERARQIYDNAEPEHTITEGQPFNDNGQPWAWSAWVSE